MLRILRRAAGKPGRLTNLPWNASSRVAAGRDIRVLVLTNVKPDCTSGPLPTVRLVTPPANGKITVRRIRLNATNVRQCLSLEIPALVALYRSAPEFEGNDTVTVEIRPNEGAPHVHRITINVTKADPGAVSDRAQAFAAASGST